MFDILVEKLKILTFSDLIFLRDKSHYSFVTEYLNNDILYANICMNDVAIIAYFSVPLFLKEEERYLGY